ncbi:MAG: DUF3800 domain-containing protein [Candidatus Aenigmarchaeota archaeon]|nr:DUF3800 domain-containing protein [Candidatus Aenigmarchaeota archaeon]
MVIKLFLDESGDMGFNFDKGSSKCFVIAVVVTNNDKQLSKCIKKVRTKHLQKKMREKPELKANNSSHSVRRRVLELVKETNAEIHYIVVNKQAVYEYLRTTKAKKKLYNFIAGIILKDIGVMLSDDATNNEIQLVADKRETNVFASKDFEQYILKLLRASGIKATVSQYSSQNTPCLQTTDFVCFAIFKKYEKNYDFYYNIIEDRIVTIQKKYY